MSQAIELNEVVSNAAVARGRAARVEIVARAASAARPKLFFDRLDAREVRVVRRVAHASRWRFARSASICLNRLGNGWLYAAVAALWLAFAGTGAWRPALAASAAVGVSHLCYALIKPRLGRLRPCDFDPTLIPPVKAIDKYSCPSGHCMTAAAVGVPLALCAPPIVPAVAATWLLIAWSRVALGHHYPTDIVLGTVLGAGVSLLVSAAVL
ncbi:MAG: phosphatase PAP2 family protein [Pyrinomonadaceae bacterium]